MLEFLSRIDFGALEAAAGGLLFVLLTVFLIASGIARIFRVRATRRMFRGAPLRQLTGRFSDDDDRALEDLLASRPGLRPIVNFLGRLLEPSLLMLGALAALQEGDDVRLSLMGAGLALLLVLAAVVAIWNAATLALGPPKALNDVPLASHGRRSLFE